MTLNTTSLDLWYHSNISSTIWLSTVAPDSKGAKGPQGPPPPFFYEDVMYKKIFAATSITLLSITAIICLLQFITRPKCIPLIKTQMSTKAGKFFFFLFIIAFISFYCQSIIFIYFILNFERHTNDEDEFTQFVVWSKLPYNIGRFIMMLFFIARLHFVFKSSAMAIRPCILIILIIFSLLEFILSLFTTFHPLYRNANESTLAALGLDNGSKHMDIASLSVRIVVSVIVMLYFIQRLVKITIKTSMKSTPSLSMSASVSRSGSGSGSGTNVSNDLYLNERQLSFIDTITKTTLLSLIGLLSTALIQSHVLFDLDTTDPQKHKAVSTLDGAINTICMYLVFNFAKTQYQFSCKYCHLSIKTFCICLLNKWMNRNDKQNQTVEMTQRV